MFCGHLFKLVDVRYSLIADLQRPRPLKHPVQTNNKVGETIKNTAHPEI